MHLLSFEELKTLNTPFLLFFDVSTALISGKLDLQQSKKSNHPVLPSVWWYLVAGWRRPGAGRWLVCSSIPSWKMLTAGASPGCPSPWGVFWLRMSRQLLLILQCFLERILVFYRDVLGDAWLVVFASTSACMCFSGALAASRVLGWSCNVRNLSSISGPLILKKFKKTACCSYCWLCLWRISEDGKTRLCYHVLYPPRSEQELLVTSYWVSQMKVVNLLMKSHL